MATRDIRTSHAHSACDVCGRTLLRGERADTYLNGGTRRSVCELCKNRALHEGWVREGTVPAFEGTDTSSERRRSLLGRLRSRSKETAQRSDDAATLGDDLDGHAWSESEAGGIDLSPPPADAGQPRPETPRPRRRREPRPEPREPQEPLVPREPRHVRAVPSSDEQKIASAAELFNGSEHRRTVAGVARSLGEPSVSILPSVARPSLVNVVISWELCWYRYDVDLSDDQPTVRVSGQGYELDELEDVERRPNAVADDSGQLTVAGV